MGKIIFVRHAKAIKREKFKGLDCDRPISNSGIKDLKKVIKVVNLKHFNLDLLYSSSYLRAYQTAVILKKIIKKEIHFLNQITPDDSPIYLNNWLKKNMDCDKNIIIVGHEPHLSKIILKLIGLNNYAIKINKSAFICIDYNKNKNSKLEWLIDPSIIYSP